MGRSGFTVAEQGHVVNMSSPLSAQTGTTSEVISMENWSHVTFICMKGAGSALTIQLEDCSAFAGTGHGTMPFKYAKEATGSGDTTDAALAWATSAGITTGAADGTFLIIEVDADELRDGYQYLRLFSATDVGGILLSWTAMLSGGRYQEDITATVIV